MTDVTQEIVDWLRARPDWLQDAAERLLASGNLGDGDIQEIAQYLKTEDGRRVSTHRTFDGLGGGNASADELRLVSIGDIQGIENLAPRVPISFGQGNLVVVYGHNGSGKSGYTRILKRACGHPRAVELKPNIFQQPPPSQQCNITYSVAGREQTVAWSADGTCVDTLRTVDIFDSEAASYYLTSETETSYVPPQIALFERLASACERVKTCLKSEQVSLKSSLPTLPSKYEQTPSGKAYRLLKPAMAQGEIERLTQWTDDNEKSLSQLEERLKTADPASQAQKARRTKSQVDQLIQQLESTASGCSAERVKAVRQAREQAASKRRAASEAAQIDSAELEGIGSETWIALWEAARAYSQSAYPEQEFPVTDDGTRCVLCHQTLEPDAQQRLRDFEVFVQGTVEDEAKKAELAYKKALDELPQILTNDSIRTRCEAADLHEEGWVERLEQFGEQAEQAVQCLRHEERAGEARPVAWPEQLLKMLTERAESLEQRALQYDADAKHFDRKQAEQYRLNLEAKRWVAQQADAVKAEVARLNQVAKYDEWARQANPRGISLKAGELAEKAISQAYLTRFRDELKRLGAAHIKVEVVKTRTKQGTALHRVALKDATWPKASPDMVLSEGERRIIALAAFLADVGEKPHPAPFIFDDPISSLDQEFEWYVALRLAQLGKERQVLVFTHRLSLYGAAEEAAKKVGDDWEKKNLEQRCIESFSGTTGHPADESAWSAKTKTANNNLLNRLDEAKKAGEAGGGDGYRCHAQGICTDFRKLLERTIEDDLLGQIVKRNRRSVQTDNRLKWLPRITGDDCQFIDGLMTKYSAFEHSQSPETPVRIPDEAELREDIESLKAWREEFNKRSPEAMA
ncbi:AAA family ATPase [Thioalkalivibrio sp. ALR17-21]|uniref:AAA family ATPase n=1 Tax=Thioalkalivibrio sp. ALR17-21 TaxID=1269813 RepID=UPI0004011E70|nr:AAA family ATPase [Thioalkalivibrio sp. ALR17-21]